MAIVRELSKLLFPTYLDPMGCLNDYTGPNITTGAGSPWLNKSDLDALMYPVTAAEIDASMFNYIEGAILGVEDYIIGTGGVDERLDDLEASVSDIEDVTETYAYKSTDTTGSGANPDFYYTPNADIAKLKMTPIYYLLDSNDINAGVGIDNLKNITLYFNHAQTDVFDDSKPIIVQITHQNFNQTDGEYWIHEITGAYVKIKIDDFVGQEGEDGSSGVFLHITVTGVLL